MRLPTAGLLLASIVLAAPSFAASEADHKACVNGSGDAAIAGCAAIIGDQHEPGRSRAAAHVNRGYEWRSKGDFDRAIADYTAALELEPKYAAAYHRRGLALYEKGDLDRALADYTAAIRIEPTPAIYTSRGDIWRAKRDIDRAIVDYGEAIRLDAKASAAFHRRGLAWREKDELDRAISDYTSAIRLDPKHVDAYQSRGMANFQKGDFLSAASDLLHAVEIKDDPYLLLWRYLTRGRIGQDGRTELAVGASRLTSKDWPFALVELYLGQRTPDEIRNSNLKPNELCEAAFFVAQFHILRGARPEARSALQAAAENCPKHVPEYDGAVAELRRLGIGPVTR